MEKEYLEQLMEKADKKRKKRKSKIDFSLKRVRALIVVIIVVCFIAITKLAGFDVDVDCTKADNTCTISKSSLLDPVPFKVSRFDTGGIIDVFVRSRKVDGNKLVYDLLLDYGETKGQYFMGYAFNTVIKANTAKMKLTNYLQGSKSTLNISKHCYFNEYFCF